MKMMMYNRRPDWYFLIVNLVLLQAAIINGQNPFVKDTVLEQLANFSCGMKWECPTTKGEYLPCACDSLCQLAGDCCQGHFETNNLPEINSEDFECASSPLVDDDILMITKCPSSWNGDRIKELCESGPMMGNDEFQTIHVSGTENGFMYKNQYCAKCHSEPYKFWRPTIGCNDSFIFRNNPEKNFKMSELLKSKSHCKISKLIPPEGAFRRECPKSNKLVDNCPQSWPDVQIRNLCENAKGIQPVYYIGEIRIKNIYCGFCGIQDISKFECPDSHPKIRTAVDFYPFSILFDINEIEKDKEKVIVCSQNQVYDPFVNVCRDALCSRNMVFKNGQCVFSGSSSDAVTSLDCPHIILNESEFEISDKGRLVIRSSQYIYDPEFYEILEDRNQVAVCSNFTQNYTSTELEYNFDDVQAILSVIGITLSIIGCVLTISVYLSFKTLRNIPGKIVISLCISLILAYLTMIIGPALRENFVGCKSFAIIMHYFFLVAFFWMNVMAIDVWYTFAYHEAGGSSGRSTRFRFYVVYVFIMAALPVILSSILNETDIAEDFSPHYGEGICWFTRRNALLVFFGLPSLLVIITNVILFLIAAKTIQSAQRNSVRLLGKEDKSMLSIYVRLTIVMGVAYLFGFLVPLYNHPAILYIFIILNTLQGLFIFVSFVCTRKVLGLIRERANIWSQSRSDTSYSGSRSTTKSSAISFRPTAGRFQ